LSIGSRNNARPRGEYAGTELALFRSGLVKAFPPNHVFHFSGGACRLQHAMGTYHKMRYRSAPMKAADREKKSVPEINYGDMALGLRSMTLSRQQLY
jgi:hypothetical protein